MIIQIWKQKNFRKYQNNKKINIIFLDENKGAGYCRNIGIEISNSDYISFIDSDDTWETNFFSINFC